MVQEKLETNILHNLRPNFQSIYFKSVDELKKHVLGRRPTLYCSSQTSCVVPFGQLEASAHFMEKERQETVLGHLSQLPPKMEILPCGHLVVEGAVSWKDARAFCRAKGFDVKTSPTEELALVCAGVSTSATGERSFGFGGIRDHIVSLTYVGHSGEEKRLLRGNNLLSGVDSNELNKYQPEFALYEASYRPYENFKNAPFPRFRNQTDLMIGTEGQLGVVTQVELEIVPLQARRYFFLLLPKWVENHEVHLEIFKRLGTFRGKILSCEMVDSWSFQFLQAKDRPVREERDILFLEICEKDLEEVYQDFFSGFDMENILEIPEEKFHQLRALVPRTVAETNSRNGVVKKGTDVQVPPEKFRELLDFYREGRKLGVPSILFGHFGDAHLHFNFLVGNNLKEVERVEDYFKELYKKVKEWKGSPFAEHGIGLLKKNFIKDFYGPSQERVFFALKENFDPLRQFFPQGFMGQSL